MLNYLNSKNVVLFHGRKIDNTPTHTLLFEKDNDKIFMSYSIVNDSFDHFTKKQGRELSIKRMAYLKNRYTRRSENNKPIETTIDNINDVLPKKITTTFDYYLKKTCKVFNISDTDKVSIIFNTDKRKDNIVNCKLNELIKVIILMYLE